MRLRLIASVLFITCFLAVGAISAIADSSHSGQIAKHKKKKKKTVYTDSSLGPSKSAGHFDGYPTYTSQWHGCKKMSIFTLDTDVSILPSSGVTEGNMQSAVTFTRNAKPPYLSWQVTPGWKICGVMANGTLSNPDVKDLLLAGFGYTSGSATGSTAPGAETIQVKIPKNAINHKDFKEFEGKTYSIYEVVDVIVYVRKK
jgi:hypothetical protein